MLFVFCFVPFVYWPRFVGQSRKEGMIKNQGREFRPAAFGAVSGPFVVFFCGLSEDGRDVFEILLKSVA